MKRIGSIVDDDGNEILPPDPTTEIGQAIYLMEYARKRGFQVPQIQIGSVTVYVNDLRQAREFAEGRVRTDEMDPDFKALLTREG